jgi:hypothetical protein
LWCFVSKKGLLRSYNNSFRADELVVVQYLLIDVKGMFCGGSFGKLLDKYGGIINQLLL